MLFNSIEYKIQRKGKCVYHFPELCRFLPKLCLHYYNEELCPDVHSSIKYRRAKRSKL